jgi:ABC-type transport system substrate-binding protein
MVVVRKRLLFWILKAYIRKWGKIIAVSFVGGLLIFFILLSTSRFLLRFLPLEHKTSIGVVGAYTIDSLPIEIVRKVSMGLSRITPDGSIAPDVAMSWDIVNGGKKYVFHLRRDIYFSDGRLVTAKNIPYEFSGVKKDIIDDWTIAYTLQDSYAPFLVTVARPMIRKGYIGLGDEIIQNIELNSSQNTDLSTNFIKTLTMFSRKNRYLVERYSFYPSEEAVKIAFSLGEINKATGLTDVSFLDTKFSSYPNTTTLRTTNTRELVTLFYNTKDSVLSDPKIRKSLTYALPESFAKGERSHIPYILTSKYANKDLTEQTQDLQHAKALMEAGRPEGSSAKPIIITIKTLGKYHETADLIAKQWKALGVKTTIEEVDTVPNTFQVYLGDFVLPRDPDQYTLWHSTSPNNITKIVNKRIDKLLEDGRKTTDEKLRVQIYKDFQKYLLEDSPAAFLYFPYEYTITRK